MCHRFCHSDPCCPVGSILAGSLRVCTTLLGTEYVGIRVVFGMLFGTFNASYFNGFFLVYSAFVSTFIFTFLACTCIQRAL